MSKKLIVLLLVLASALLAGCGGGGGGSDDDDNPFKGTWTGNYSVGDKDGEWDCGTISVTIDEDGNAGGTIESDPVKWGCGTATLKGTCDKNGNFVTANYTYSIAKWEAKMKGTMVKKDGKITISDGVVTSITDDTVLTVAPLTLSAAE